MKEIFAAYIYSEEKSSISAYPGAKIIACLFLFFFLIYFYSIVALLILKYLLVFITKYVLEVIHVVSCTNQHLWMHVLVQK